ncbi:MAG: SLC13 family permease [Desulfatiglandales bacterium]
MTVFLVKEILDPDIVIFSSLLLLIVGKIVTIQEAFVGFSNSGMLTVGFLFIVAKALQETGVLNQLGNIFLGNTGGKKMSVRLLRFLFPVSAISAFFNNTPVVAMLIPVIHTWARKHEYSVSKFLIPLSYAAILGGTCTLIGTSTNLVVHGLMIETGIGGMSFFEISKIGIPLMFIGVFAISFTSHRFLPERKKPIIELGDQTREYVIELKVQPDYRYLGYSIEEAGLRHLKGLFLFQIERNQKILAPVGHNEELHVGDRLFFTGLPKTIIELQKTPGLTVMKDMEFDLKNYNSDELKTFEAVISPTSPLIGYNVRESNFRGRYNAAILAIHRSGERIKKKVGDIVFRAGDTLLILAGRNFLKDWYNSNDFYLISESADIPSKPKWYSLFSLSLLFLMILSMAFNVVPILVSVSIAAVILIISKCITPHEARKSVEWSVLLIIASSFGIAKAIDNSGVAYFLANKLVLMAGSFGILGLLAGIYFMTSLYTELITNNAAAALLFPISLSAATQAGVDPRPFVIAVAIGASASFATPLGYQTNLMVYTPGGYKFTDFLKIGIPMNIFIGCMAIMIIYVLNFI